MTLMLLIALAEQGSDRARAASADALPSVAFHTSDRCVACHNGMITSRGDDLSIGTDWSTSLMANASRDPYWHASVRKEVTDHPESRARIEDECAVCHMPVSARQSKLHGTLATVLDQLPLGPSNSKSSVDGVTCSICHQIAAQKLGTSDTYNGNFVVADAVPNGVHPEFGPYEIGTGLQQVMRSSTAGFQPQPGEHMRSAELCATCHTLITEARNAEGAVVGRLPEQMPYQEWLHSDFKDQRTCQSCHMPAVESPVPIARILAAPREGVLRHQFVGANFLMQKLLGRYHDELDAGATTSDLTNAAERTIRYLQSESAQLTSSPPRLSGGRLETEVSVRNLGGHKLPTAYPSRRVWLHVVVRGAHDNVVFESGALRDDGSIVGNDNDDDAARFEPHYTEIRDGGQVQIYEAILQDTRGGVTTGLLTAVGYAKDNRLLPHGFDKREAPADISVCGAALTDPTFDGNGHRLRYSIDVGNATGPFEVLIELLYQPIGFRWAGNLKAYKAPETQRFSTYYDSMSRGTAVVLARVSSRTSTQPEVRK